MPRRDTSQQAMYAKEQKFFGSFFQKITVPPFPCTAPDLMVIAYIFVRTDDHFDKK
jgi:hypothetical protein